MEHKALHAYLTPEAHDAWHEVAKSHEVTVSALLEAFAYRWAEMQAREEDLSDDLKRRARKIDSARRRRTATQ
jgi:preprotein translocase subunit SecY